MVMVFLARRAGLRPAASAVTGTLAAVPALLYAYALMGSIKEISALPSITLMGALVVCARELRLRAGPRAALPFAFAAAAALDSIGLAAAPWVGLFALFGLVAAVPVATRRDLRPLLIGGSVAGGGDRRRRPADVRAARENAETRRRRVQLQRDRLRRPRQPAAAAEVHPVVRRLAGRKPPRRTALPEPDLHPARDRRRVPRARHLRAGAPPRLGDRRLRGGRPRRLVVPAPPRHRVDRREAARDPLADDRARRARRRLRAGRPRPRRGMGAGGRRRGRRARLRRAALPRDQPRPDRPLRRARLDRRTLRGRRTDARPGLRRILAVPAAQDGRRHPRRGLRGPVRVRARRGEVLRPQLRPRPDRHRHGRALRDDRDAPLAGLEPPAVELPRGVRRVLLHGVAPWSGLACRPLRDRRGRLAARGGAGVPVGQGARTPRRARRPRDDIQPPPARTSKPTSGRRAARRTSTSWSTSRDGPTSRSPVPATSKARSP